MRMFMECVNCESNDVYSRVNIRGSALVENGEIRSLVDYVVEQVLFHECRDCGHRWEGK
ncbi:hypothetical protein [Paenibacillus xylanexedens]|uniref:hypothetical protein n=1 Tax=Paenibacillus xylanexedens TaxID=528191 RepID=UPI000A55DAF6|nr:hypothetical protein [Paenibacillus xylanexedens]